MDESTLSTLPELAARLGSDLVRVQGRRHRGATGVPWTTPDTIVTTLGAVDEDDAVDVGLADGKEVRAEVIGRDPGLALALLRVPAGALGAPQTQTWRDPEELRVGEPALALARPGQSVRAALGILGVVGGTPLRLRGGGTLDRYVELDRDLPRGFSGGLVVDLQGRVIGLATRSVVRGASLALGLPTVKRVLDKLDKHGHVPRGYIGVGVYPARLPKAVADTLGRSGAIVVVAVEQDGPAQRAGITLGDVILAVDGGAVATPFELRHALEDRAGEHVTLSVLRGGQTTETTVETAARK
ncbi:MAG TPA: trypsin-like peptidase domain-containing protein [Nannocystaceae bacterium]|nr:trypsin-like peptidase domain-containing protein [Nannocystaceae bacterium]